MDAWVATGLGKFEDKAFQSVSAENLDLGTEEEKKAEQEKMKEAGEKFKPLLATMQEVLKDHVKEIKLSERLTESPVCLVSATDGASAHMERLIESMGQAAPKSKRIMELNPSHPLYEKMLSVSNAQQKEWAEILYQQALLNEGSQIENPYLYSQKIANLMISAALH